MSKEKMELEKNRLGFPSLFAVSIGIVVASTTLVSLGQGMGIGGYAFIVSMVIAFILMMFQAFTFSELAIMLPKAGSISAYTEVAMGHFPAIISTIAGYIIVQLLAAPAELSVAAIVVDKVFFPDIDISPLYSASMMLCLFMTFNLLGVDVFANFQMIFTGVMIFTIAFIGIGGLVGPGVAGLSNVTPAMGFGDIFALAALGIWLFIGTEFICPLAEEAKHPQRDIPLAMIFGLIVILLLKILYGVASFRYMPLDKLAASPIPHVEVAKAIFGKAGMVWVGLASFCATASTVNTLLAAVPRMLYGMAHMGQVPKVFAWIHPKFKTPWVGIILLACGMFVQILTGISTTETIVVFIVASAFSWLLAYIIAHLDLIILRFRYKDLPRPWKTPGYPVPQVLGILGTIYIMLNIFPDPVVKARIYKYALCFIAGAAVYALLWCWLKMKKGLFKPVPLEKALEE
ncbi:MAG: putative amino acid permease YhdG [Syntrophorhabdus sp. PtaU1.Bin058]|nr:MAG: putative amino acid permease YhdG [Syntrophorhabdus sp. PtaU1.Bin058]